MTPIMPWSPQHKLRTRERIIGAAAGALRGRGVAGARLDDIMRAAGLTHGGFYGHFRSKEDLVGDAVDHANEETIARLSKALDGLSGERRLLAVIAAYLGPEHVAHPDHGCPVAAVGAEAA